MKSLHHSPHLRSHSLGLFTQGVKCFTNPFLHSLSGLFRTAFTDLELGPDLEGIGVCLVSYHMYTYSCFW